MYRLIAPLCMRVNELVYCSPDAYDSRARTWRKSVRRALARQPIERRGNLQQDTTAFRRHMVDLLHALLIETSKVLVVHDAHPNRSAMRKHLRAFRFRSFLPKHDAAALKNGILREDEGCHVTELTETFNEDGPGPGEFCPGLRRPASLAFVGAPLQR